MALIPQSELSFHPHSFADPDGRLFSWNGGLYRAISREKTPFLTQLLRDGTIPKLVDRGLVVGTEATDLEIEGYGMVLRHHRVPFVSYPHEWCPAMFKDAALAYLELRRELLRYGLTLRDTHPWNLLFEGTKPVYVDVTSIRPATAETGFVDYGKFCQYYLHPLTLMCNGHGRIVRSLLPDYDGIQPTDFSVLTRQSRAAALKPIMGRVASVLRQTALGNKESNSRAQAARLDRLTREIQQIRVPVDGAIPQSAADPSLLIQQDALKQTISELSCQSILAIGAKTPWPARLAASLGKSVVSFDTDSNHIAALYHDARDRDLQLLPLVMDFTDPTPSRGLASHVSIAAAQRLRCDLVLALGLVSAVVLEKRLRFDQVIDGLSQFSRRWLIVDLNGDLSEQPGREYACYTTDNFMNALAKRFANVRVLPAAATHHVLFFCEN